MKTTKKSLFVSSLTLVLCLAMLLGTTWAWFTDEVKSGTNRIVAGNLDVEMYYKNMVEGADWVNVVNAPTEENPGFFVNAEGKDILWEPGVVSVCDFEVRNEGNLALKYKFNTEAKDFNAAGSTYKLSSVIKAAVVPIGTDVSTREAAIAAGKEAGFSTLAGFAKEGDLLPGTGEGADINSFRVILYWEPTVNDNNYNMNNGQSAEGPMGINIDIKLLATQLESESDSYDYTYDAQATYPGGTASDAALEFDPDDSTIVTGITDPEAKIVIIPATATKIAPDAFKNNTSIESITMPITIEIGEAAFEGCESLKNVTLVVPDGENAKIDTEAFACCPSLESVVVNGDASIGQYGFYCDYDNAWDSLDVVFNGNVTISGAAFAQNGTVLGDSTVTFKGNVTIDTTNAGGWPNATFIFSSIEEIRFAAGKVININGNCTNEISALKRVVFEGAPASGSSISANAFAGAKGSMEGVYIGSCTKTEWGALGLPTHFNGEYWSGGDVIESLPALN